MFSWLWSKISGAFVWLWNSILDVFTNLQSFMVWAGAAIMAVFTITAHVLEFIYSQVLAAYTYLTGAGGPPGAQGGIGGVPSAALDVVNTFFPLHEAVSLFSASVAVLITCMTIRIIKKCIPTLS